MYLMEGRLLLMDLRALIADEDPLREELFIIYNRLLISIHSTFNKTLNPINYKFIESITNHFYLTRK